MTTQQAGPTGATSPAPVVTFRVLGTPAAQGSTKAFAVRNRGGYTGRVAVTHANGPKIASWRAAIIGRVELLPAAPHFTGPVSVTVTFWLARPKAHYGTGRNAAQLVPSAPRLPGGQPDLDKLARAVLDALSAAGLWDDDAQVVTLAAGKLYADDGQRPGAVITVTGMEASHG